MTLDDINKKIQAENDSYYRDLNRLQQKTLDLKKRHQRNIEYLRHQKEQASKKKQYEELEKVIKKCFEKD